MTSKQPSKRKHQPKPKGWGPQSKRLETKSWGTWILAVIGSFAIFLLRLQGETVPTALVIEYSSLLIGSGAVHSWMGRRVAEPATIDREPLPRGSVVANRWMLLIGLLVIAAPWIRNAVTRIGFGGTGEATELVWLGMLQHAAVWQAAVAVTARHEWLSFLLSCFMMLFGTATSDRAGMFLVVVPFGLLAAWWLLSQYWKSVAKGFVATSSIPLVRLRIGIIGGLCLVTVAVGALAIGTGNTIISLDGFMPTSGGKGGSDPAARQGVGDGDMMVAAKDQAYSFGPVESDMYLESELPSLYDLTSERYGDVKKRNKEYSRAVSLEQQAKHTHESISESKQKGREFSTLRNPSQKSNSSRPGDSKSYAVVQIIGSTPQLLRLETYDVFDGFDWDHSDIDHKAHSAPFRMTELGTKPWAIVDRFPSEISWPVSDRTTVKIINLKSPRIMTPPLTTHVHVDKVSQEDFYSLTPDGQLMMPSRAYIPQLTVLHLLHQVHSLHSLRKPFESLSGLALDRKSLMQEGSSQRYWMRSYLEIPEQVSGLDEHGTQLLSHIPDIVQSRWTDWQRVEAIIDALRDKVEVDQNVEIPDDALESATFALKHNRGTDFLIATSAAMLIRNLNIPARLVSGFSVRPERFDVKAGMTEVLPEDLHTWVEVYVHGAWIPVEPSGTYPKPRENRNWIQWGIETAWWMRDTALTHPIRTACGLLIVLSLVLMRRRLANGLVSFLSLGCFWLPGQWRLSVSLKLLRFRRWLAGLTKPKGWTMARWLDDEFQYLPQVPLSERESFVHMVQTITYAPRSVSAKATAAMLPKHDRVLRSIVLQGITDLFRLDTIFRRRKKFGQMTSPSFKHSP